MSAQLDLGGIPVEVVFKDIKNVHLSVYPPGGRVRIAAPARMSLDTVRLYAIAKLDWIKRQQAALQAQERETPREYLERESHFLWGRRYLLQIAEADLAPSVELKHNHMLLTVRSGAGPEKREAVVAAWYRQQLKLAAAPLIEKWEALLGVKADHCFIQRMKTRWGSCNPHSHSIRLNTELAKKPRECLEYILIHELLHLLEPHHNDRFHALMDHHLPPWRSVREELNRAPLAHEDWEY